MKILTFIFLTVMCIRAYAQKLPVTQQISLRAPVNIKVDGKANEWGKMQAYNTATECYYTMTNDDKKLYLIVQASGGVMTNITNGGIKLVIQKKGGKNDAGAPFIKFPYLEKGKMVLINPKDFAGATDTIVMTYNKQLAKSAKWIYTRRLNGVDSLLSVYNDRGVAAAGNFDNNMKYTMEMSVDLALLGLSVENHSGFSYHIIVNGEPNRYMPASVVSYMKKVTFSGVSDLTELQIQQNLERFDNYSNKMAASRDFLGEYTLAN